MCLFLDILAVGLIVPLITPLTRELGASPKVRRTLQSVPPFSFQVQRCKLVASVSSVAGPSWWACQLLPTVAHIGQRWRASSCRLWHALFVAPSWLASKPLNHDSYYATPRPRWFVVIGDRAASNDVWRDTARKLAICRGSVGRGLATWRAACLHAGWAGGV
jgi:hypothetical protein